MSVRRRLVLASAVTLFGICCVVGLWGVRVMLAPFLDEPARADAVAVFAGGPQDVRLSAGLELVERGVADTIVISVGNRVWAEGSELERLCEEQDIEAEVICLAPEPDNTIGEAMMFGRLGNDRGWSDLVVVTSRSHIHRAATWTARCFDGDVAAVASNSGGADYLIEWLANMHALVVRDCPDE